ncbi:MAG TPA: sulfotransferase domain-containing protein [Solirubrobacterales bacterium]|nr:sulfotransferase domain-containing protein [Solirubrobacterales bacterium]
MTPANVEVREVALADAVDGCLGFHVDSPRAGDSSRSHALGISGWVAGGEGRVDQVEVIFEGQALGAAPLTRKREDVLSRFPELSDPTVGWETEVSLVGLPEEFELFVRVVLGNGERHRLATIRGTRTKVLPPDESALQPLIVSTYGRTGSTWLMRLFDQHPATLAYRPFEYEPRAVSYWAALLGALSQPASYLQPLATDLSNEHWWLGDATVPTDIPPPDAPVQDELSRDAIEAVAALCRQRIESFYEAVARTQSKPNPRYFAEKVSPDPGPWRLITELFPSTREVILVRDFRDMACSILAYNEKTKTTSFGRERVDTDLEFLQELRAAATSLLYIHQKRGETAFLLRYEDLIVEPEDTLTKLFEFLGISSSEETVASVLERASRETDAMAGHRTSSDPRQSVGRWRRDLSPEMQEACVDAFDDVLAELGYEPTASVLA